MMGTRGGGCSWGQGEAIGGKRGRNSSRCSMNCHVTIPGPNPSWAWFPVVSFPRPRISTWQASLHTEAHLQSGFSYKRGEERNHSQGYLHAQSKGLWHIRTAQRGPSDFTDEPQRLQAQSFSPFPLSPSLPLLLPYPSTHTHTHMHSITDTVCTQVLEENFSETCTFFMYKIVTNVDCVTVFQTFLTTSVVNTVALCSDVFFRANAPRYQLLTAHGYVPLGTVLSWGTALDKIISTLAAHVLYLAHEWVQRLAPLPQYRLTQKDHTTALGSAEASDAAASWTSFSLCLTLPSLQALILKALPSKPPAYKYLPQNLFPENPT